MLIMLYETFRLIAFLPVGDYPLMPSKQVTNNDNAVYATSNGMSPLPLSLCCDTINPILTKSS